MIHVSYKFARLTDRELNDFGIRIDTSLTGNAVYPTPPADATLVMLEAATDDFTIKIEKAAMGGPTDTAAKNLSRQTLLGLLRKLAGYVQITAKDMEQLLSSGFESRSENRAQSPLEKPPGLLIKNGTTGQLIGRLPHPVKNSNLYEGRAKSNGTWMPSVFTGDSQHIIFAGLTAGTTYTMEVRALGGSTGQSDWTDPVSHMAM